MVGEVCEVGVDGVVRCLKWVWIRWCELVLG